MYNLNYTYLTDLEVDTRQTFADISDDLMLLNYQSDSTNTLKKSDMKTVISSWQNYFWNTDDPENIRKKQALEVVFTDITIIHDAGQGGVPSTSVDDKEMVTIGELNNFFSNIDTNRGWAGGHTYTELCCELSSAINTLHRKFNNTLNYYPKGSIVVSKQNPGQGEDGFGSWQDQNASYLAEKINGHDISVGIYTAGKVESNSVGSDLSQVIVKPSTTGGIPSHKHKLSFNPPAKSDSGGEPATDMGAQGVTYTSYRAGRDGGPGGSDYSGASIVGNQEPNTSCIAIASDASVPRSSNDDKDWLGMKPKFNVSSTKILPENANVNVAPTTFPIDAKVWKRTN